MDDVINYVTNTPANSNPNVLRDMLKTNGAFDGGASDGSSSSGNGILMVNISKEGAKKIMDKTWQEIHDANFAFTKEDQYVQEIGATATYVCPVALTAVANGEYIVGISTYETGEGTAALRPYIAESADGYPKQGGSV
jgi:hypothetical protein